jgi:MFS family permease
MNVHSAALDSRKAWVIASMALAILTISYGAPLLAAVALKPIAADLHITRPGPSAAGSFTYISAAFGGIIAGWLSGHVGIRRIVVFGAVMLAVGLVVSASGGLLHLYFGHGVLYDHYGFYLPALATGIAFNLVNRPPVAGAASAGARTAHGNGLMQTATSEVAPSPAVKHHRSPVGAAHYDPR